MEPTQELSLSTSSRNNRQHQHGFIHAISSIRPNRKSTLIVCLGIFSALMLALKSLLTHQSQPIPRSLTDENYTLPKDIHNLQYEFMNNITQSEYVGNWSQLKYNKTLIGTKAGVAELFFFKARNQLYIIDINSNNYLKGVFYLKEGKYIDHYLRGNFNLTFPENFTASLKAILQPNATEKELVIRNEYILLDLFECDYLVKKMRYKLNSTAITLTLIKNERIIKEGFDEMLISAFSVARLRIEGNFSIEISGEVKDDPYIEPKISNYTLLLSLISFAEIYLIFKLLFSVNANSQIGLNLDLMTITISIMYKSFICTAHFYLSLSSLSDDLSYQYGIPSILYFFAFSVFELRLLFFAWKARYNELFATNQALFRRKLFIFYFGFYLLLFASLISIKTIFSHFIYAVLFFSCTWFFQIIHSVRTGTRPPMSNSYIVLLTFSKLFLPVYLKAYDENIFEYKPAYGKVTLLSSIVIAEMMVLLMQKAFGAKVIVPRCLKTVPYNYYRESVKIEEHISSNPDCPICMQSLKESGTDEIFSVNDKESEGNARKLLLIGVLIEKMKKFFQSLSLSHQRKAYMITPCDHIYHSMCLEEWMGVKNECPYCKRQIPPLE